MSCCAGSVPATGFLKQSGLHMDSKGFITVNKVVKVFCSTKIIINDPKCTNLFIDLNSTKLVPRWCRQMLMVSLPEEMWWCFLSHLVTTKRWTSLTGKWLMYTVSVLQNLHTEGCYTDDALYTLKDKHVHNLTDRKSGSSRHDGPGCRHQNCALLLVSHVWEDHTLCR